MIACRWERTSSRGKERVVRSGRKDRGRALEDRRRAQVTAEPRLRIGAMHAGASSGGARGAMVAARVVRQLSEALVGVCAGSRQAIPSLSRIQKFGNRDIPAGRVPVSTTERDPVGIGHTGIGSRQQEIGGMTAVVIGVHSRSREWPSTKELGPRLSRI